MAFVANRKAPTYEKIRALTNKLQQQGNESLTKKREIAKQLEQALSDFETRKKLATEATPGRSGGADDLSIAARRCHALSKLWSSAFTAAMTYATNVVKKNTKTFQVADISLPYKLLLAASEPDEAFDTQGLGIAKLSKTTVRKTLRFCLEMLQDEKVKQVAGETYMLEMLAKLCEKRECMGYFKYTSDFEAVLSEITIRFTEEVPEDTFTAACKAFCTFFETSSQLGIQVQMFVSDCLNLVAEYCKGSTKTVNSFTMARLYLFNAVALILFSHPEHSIGPMKRCGHQLLRYCKKAYANAPSKHREAFDRYLLAHL
jgi:hypothetical protein